MKFISTRGESPAVTAQEAILQGIATDGGLYVPESFPRISAEEIAEMRGMPYEKLAARILGLYMTDFSEAELQEICGRAYKKFDDPRIAPLTDIGGGLSMLELFHGPTFAFKDVALQILPHLMRAAKKKCGEERQILILTATSGDTGKAALSGFCDVPGVSVCVFYPHGGVSEVQRLQMTTQVGENLKVFAVKGNFDDTQSGVKRIFLSEEIKSALNEKGVVLSSANSINLGRLLPQVVYYFYAYANLSESGEGVNFAVPTGNFGNILAGYIAMRMGLPVRKLICASNENRVLYDFIETGVYDINRAFHLTASPSMDILISSNLERLLYEVSDRSADTVRSLMEALKTHGKYRLSEDGLKGLKAKFAAGWADDGETAETIKRAHKERGIVIDSHTAVALKVAEELAEDKMKTVVLSTASPYKFPAFVLKSILGEAPKGDDFAAIQALHEISGVPVPEEIRILRSLPERHRDVISIDQMKDVIFKEDLS